MMCQRRGKRRGIAAGATAAEIWRRSWLGISGLICGRHQGCRGCAPPLLACMPHSTMRFCSGFCIRFATALLVCPNLIVHSCQVFNHATAPIPLGLTEPNAGL